MIRFGKKDIAQIFKGKNPIAAVYRGATLVWQAVRSCFGAGAWNEEKPYIEDEGWKE